MSIQDTIEKLVDSKIEKAMQGGPQTVLAEYKGTDSQGKGWVVIAGSTESTPITRATVEAAPGDTVSVTIGDGKCVMDANISNPSAGVAGVRKAEMTAEQAQDDAEKAIAFSQQASTAASSAQASAQSAANAAGDAQATANAVHGMAEQAQADAATAKAAADAATEVLDGMQEAAEAAGTTLEGIYQDAKDAETAAESAQSSASAATRSLSDVERVVGTLNWIAEHGEYVNQAGQTFDASKVYYTRSGTAPNYVYTVVPEPVAEDIASYYLLRVDESVQNYIASHLWMDNYGLNLSVDSADGWRIHQGTVDGTKAIGTYIIDPSGVIALTLSADGVVIGSQSATHTTVSPFGMSMTDFEGSRRIFRVGGNVGDDGYNSIVKTFYVGGSGGSGGQDTFMLGYSQDEVKPGSISVSVHDSSVTPEWSVITVYDTVHETMEVGVKFDELIPPGASVGVSFRARKTDYTNMEFGKNASASGSYAFAHGENVTADGDKSTAEGLNTRTIGIASHAEGVGTIARYDYQTVLGKYNKDTTGNQDFLLIVGNGESNAQRSTGFAVRWNGLVDQAGRTAYPLFIYNGKPTEANAPVKPCFIYDTSDGGLYYYSG